MIPEKRSKRSNHREKQRAVTELQQLIIDLAIYFYLLLTLIDKAPGRRFHPETQELRCDSFHFNHQEQAWEIYISALHPFARLVQECIAAGQYGITLEELPDNRYHICRILLSADLFPASPFPAIFAMVGTSNRTSGR